MSESMQEQRTESKPEPAVGQVWQWMGSAHVGKGPPRTIYGFGDGGRGVHFAEDGDAFAETGHLRAHPAWACVGIETPNGRVMVGEVRRAPLHGGGSANLEARRIEGRYVRMTDGRAFLAEVVATWPVWPRVAPYATREDLAKAPPITINVSGTSDWPRLMQKMADDLAVALRGGIALSPPDPRAEREQRRREIDRVLADDARQHPAFATARRAALLYEIETGTGYGRNHDAGTTRSHLWCFHEYERIRGGMSRPSPEALAYAGPGGDILEATANAYERARTLP